MSNPHNTHASSHDSHDDEVGHTLPFKLYVQVLCTLLALTAITVVVSRFDFGNMNLVVAMVIASIKAGIVGLFFMHVKYESPLLWTYIAIPFILLAIMMGGMFLDDMTRTDKVFPAPGGTRPAIVAEHH